MRQSTNTRFEMLLITSNPLSPPPRFPAQRTEPCDLHAQRQHQLLTRATPVTQPNFPSPRIHQRDAREPLDIVELVQSQTTLGLDFIVRDVSDLDGLRRG